MDFSDLPDLCTPTEAAEVLRWTRAAVQKACRDGALAHIRLSKKQTLIEKTDLAEFLRMNKCRAGTEECRYGTAKTETVGKSVNMKAGSVSGEQLVYAAVRKHKRALQSLSPEDNRPAP